MKLFASKFNKAALVLGLSNITVTAYTLSEIFNVNPWSLAPAAYFYIASIFHEKIFSVEVQKSQSEAANKPSPELQLKFDQICKEMKLNNITLSIVEGKFVEYHATASLHGINFGKKLLENLSEDATDFVLRHELSHIKERHSEAMFSLDANKQAAKIMFKAGAAYFTFRVTGGIFDYNITALPDVEVAIAANAFVNYLVQSHYSRKDEYEADIGGVKNVENLKGAREFFEKTEKLPRSKFKFLRHVPFLRPHPSSEKRMLVLEQAKTSLMQGPSNLPKPS